MRAQILRQCGKSAAMAAVGYVGESRLFLFGMLLRLLRVLLLLSVWRMVLAGRGTVSGMTLGGVLTYTLAAEMFAEILQCRTWLEDAFWSGAIITRMLRPMSLFAQFASEMFGPILVGLVTFSLPLFLCAPLLRVDPLPASGSAALLFLVSLALAVSVGLALEYIFAGLAILFEMPPYVLTRVRAAIGGLLSGALLPLALLPWNLGSVLAWLPFASQASAPLRIYTGTGNAPSLLAIQVVWCAILWPVARRIWRLGRERMVTVDG
jgi:ABC-2 type transport system permease protein